MKRTIKGTFDIKASPLANDPSTETIGGARMRFDKTFHGETVAGPFYNSANPDQFVVYFTLDITPKATGKRITRDEVGVYTVKGDKITREQFFYDGEH